MLCQLSYGEAKYAWNAPLSPMASCGVKSRLCILLAYEIQAGYALEDLPNTNEKIGIHQNITRKCQRSINAHMS